MSIPQRTLADWQPLLDGVQLPILKDDYRRARQALNDSQLSIREIVQRLDSCPALVLSIFREANRYSEPERRAESLEVALTRIGLNRTLQILARIPQVSAQDLPQPLAQLLLISQHASQQGTGLFGVQLARLWQEIHWNSLLFLSPLWCLLLLHPQLLEDWEQQVLIGRKPLVRHSRATLGVSVIELCLGQAEHWNLPEWVITGYRMLHEQPRRLATILRIARNPDPLARQQLLDRYPHRFTWMSAPCNTALLANALALTSHFSWGGSRTLRWQLLSALYLGQPLQHLQPLSHQAAARSARNHARPGLWHPAQGLNMPWNTQFQLPLLKPETDSAPAPIALKRWRSCCALLLQSPSPFANILQLATAARDAYQAAGLQRLLILQYDTGRKVLVVRQYCGLAELALQLQLSPEHSQLLRLLMTQPKQLQITPQTLARLAPLLPGSLKSLFDSEQLLLRSIASQGRVALIVIADQDRHPIGAKVLQAFDKTSQCLSQALDHYRNRGR